jgi:hypothetical protein
MRKILSAIAVSFCLLTLFGCGAANLAPALNSQSERFSILPGNWNFTAASSTKPNSSEFLIGGHLQQSGNTVSGVLHIASSRCFKVDKDVPVSGTIEDGTANLTSLPIDRQVMHASLMGHGNKIVGNYSFSGGCSNGDEGTLNGNLVPPVSGIWNAIDSEPGKAAASVNMALAQSAQPNGHGVYPISGTFSFRGSPCQVSGRITSGYVAGEIVVLNASTDEATGGTGTFRMEGDVAVGHSPSIVGAYSYNSGACKDQAGALTFTP